MCIRGVDTFYATLLSINHECYVLNGMEILKQLLKLVKKPFGLLFVDTVYINNDFHLTANFSIIP